MSTKLEGGHFQILSPAMEAEIRALVESVIDERLPAETQSDPYLTVKQAAEAAGIPEQTIRKWISQKRVRVYRAGRCVRVRLSEIVRGED
jgi:excisionase family DNA binding protein